MKRNERGAENYVKTTLRCDQTKKLLAVHRLGCQVRPPCFIQICTLDHRREQLEGLRSIDSNVIDDLHRVHHSSLKSGSVAPLDLDGTGEEIGNKLSISFLRFNCL